MVDVTKEEIVDWTIPVSRELIPAYAIPPVRVEAAVGEVGEFCQEVEDAFPNSV